MCGRLRTVFVFSRKVCTEVEKRDIYIAHRPNLYLLEDCIGMGRNVTDLTATEAQEMEWHQCAEWDVISIITKDHHWPRSPMISHGHFVFKLLSYISLPLTVKGKAVPLQAWSDPEGSTKLRAPYFTTTAQDGGKVVSLTHRPPLHPGNIPGTHFC
jgi:hypothetical protein